MSENSTKMPDSSFSMIHEVLFALNGNNGSFFETSGFKIEVNENLPLTPGERVLINKILTVAANYKRLKTFVDEIVMSQNMAVEVSGPGMSQQYVLALCKGLLEVLEPFREAVDRLEQTILLDPHLPLAFVLSEVDEHACLLQVLNYILDKMEDKSEPLSGCRILELLHRNSQCVVANVQTAVHRIQRSCHEVLFKQLGAWLFQGHLNEHHQFFIVQEQRPSVLTGADVEILQETGSSSLYAAYSEFKLCNNLLPSYIPLSLARNILYVGQTVVMIQRNPKNETGSSTDSERLVVDVWGGKSLEFLRQLQDMQSADTFQLHRLTRLVESARLCVTQHLRVMAVEEARLMEEVQLMKDLFLLGRGELFLEFIRLANTALSQTPTNLTLREAKQALRLAARNIGLAEDTLEKFHISIAQTAITGWDGLSLSCNVQWPLHLLFNEAAFIDYNCLFRFLLRVRRVQTELHALWKCQMEKKTGCEENLELWQLRRNFTFLVDNLQYYLQVDVLESQYSVFVASIEKSDNFEVVLQAHSRALANIMSQSFLLSGKSTEKTIVKTEGCARPQNPVMRCLLVLLDLSSELCECASNIDKVGVVARLQAMDDAFIKQVGLLKQLLLGLQGQPSATALSQLLLRLDFNSWISKHCVTIDHLLT